MVFCIPRHLVEKLKESAIKGEVDIRKLYDMTSAERRDFFAKHTDAEVGKFINTKFEQAMISKQKTALTDWAKSVFSPEAKKKPVYKSITDKINSLDDLGVLSSKAEKAFLEDLVSDKLGLSVTPEQIRIISEKAKKITEAQQELGTDLGNPLKAKETSRFFEAKKGMDDYLQSVIPANRLKVLTGTIGRGMMLFSVKSPLLNIGSNIEVGLTESLARRISDRTIRGADGKLARDYMAMVNKVYQKTGYDISRMMSLTDTGASGARVLGDTVHAQGKGAIRKAGRVVEDIVFKQLMGAPDVAFSSFHFADSVNLNSLKLANGNKVKAREMMQDAMRIDPQMPQGEVLRQQAILDAQKATWTDKSKASILSEGIRKLFNDVSGDLRVGDYLFPFVKTPANVIATGMDYAGMGIPKALFTTVKAIRSGELGSREHVRSVSRDLVRSGLGLTAAVIIASQLKDDDYVGAYDPARAQIEALRNSNTNSIRIGGKWISTDWFGPLAVSVSAIMYARKYGDTPQEKVFQYGKGVGSQALKLPGVSDIWDYIQTSSYKQNQSLEEMTGEAKNYIIDQLSSRLIPSFIGDTAKALDPNVRVSAKGKEAIKAKLPILRQGLPIKKDIFGEEMKSETGLSTMLFGSRLKTSRETALVKELSDVSASMGKGITFTDWDKSSSQTLAQFKEKKGNTEFNQAKIEYGKKLKEMIQQEIDKAGYKDLSNDEKLKLFNDIDSKAMDKIFSLHKFKYKKAK